MRCDRLTYNYIGIAVYVARVDICDPEHMFGWRFVTRIRTTLHTPVTAVISGHSFLAIVHFFLLIEKALKNFEISTNEVTRKG